MIVRPLRPEDRTAWEVLARGYKDFYRTDVPAEGYTETWRRLLNGADLHGVGAWLDGALVGIRYDYALDEQPPMRPAT